MYSVGARELDILQSLWREGTGTVAEVQRRLPDTIAYNTVLTILRNLESKGLVGHTAEGRTHRYHAAVSEEAVQRGLVGRLMDGLFRGSPFDMMAHLVEREALSAEDLRALRGLVEGRLAAADAGANGSGDAPPASNPETRTAHQVPAAAAPTDTTPHDGRP
jgi:BlaI family penicillinase repressor